MVFIQRLNSNTINTQNLTVDGEPVIGAQGMGELIEKVDGLQDEVLLIKDNIDDMVDDIDALVTDLGNTQGQVNSLQATSDSTVQKVLLIEDDIELTKTNLTDHIDGGVNSHSTIDSKLGQYDGHLSSLSGHTYVGQDLRTTAAPTFSGMVVNGVSQARYQRSSLTIPYLPDGSGGTYFVRLCIFGGGAGLINGLPSFAPGRIRFTKNEGGPTSNSWDVTLIGRGFLSGGTISYTGQLVASSIKAPASVTFIIRVYQDSDGSGRIYFISNNSNWGIEQVVGQNISTSQVHPTFEPVKLNPFTDGTPSDLVSPTLVWSSESDPTWVDSMGSHAVAIDPVNMSYTINPLFNLRVRNNATVTGQLTVNSFLNVGAIAVFGYNVRIYTGFLAVGGLVEARGGVRMDNTQSGLTWNLGSGGAKYPGGNPPQGIISITSQSGTTYTLSIAGHVPTLNTVIGYVMKPQNGSGDLSQVQVTWTNPTVLSDLTLSVGEIKWVYIDLFWNGSGWTSTFAVTTGLPSTRDGFLGTVILGRVYNDGTIKAITGDYKPYIDPEAPFSTCWERPSYNSSRLPVRFETIYPGGTHIGVVAGEIFKWPGVSSHQAGSASHWFPVPSVSPITKLWGHVTGLDRFLLLSNGNATDHLNIQYINRYYDFGYNTTPTLAPKGLFVIHRLGILVGVSGTTPIVEYFLFWGQELYHSQEEAISQLGNPAYVNSFRYNVPAYNSLQICPVTYMIVGTSDVDLGLARYIPWKEFGNQNYEGNYAVTGPPLSTPKTANFGITSTPTLYIKDGVYISNPPPDFTGYQLTVEGGSGVWINNGTENSAVWNTQTFSAEIPPGGLRWVCVEGLTGNIVSLETMPASWTDFVRYVPIGRVWYDSVEGLTLFPTHAKYYYDTFDTATGFGTPSYNFKGNPVTVSPNGTNPADLDISGGNLFRWFAVNNVNSIDHVFQSNPLTPFTQAWEHLSSSTSYTVMSQAAIRVAMQFYDERPFKGLVPNGEYVVHRIARYAGSDVIVFLYGQATYGTFANARNSIGFEDFQYAQWLSDMRQAAPICYIIVQQSESDYSNATFVPWESY